MERAFKLILGIVAASLLLGWIIEPALVVIGGGLLWVFILLITGGAEDGNPYRTMRKSGLPDHMEVGRYMKQQKVAKKQPVDTTIMRSFFIAGAVLIFIGIIWMKAQGTW